MQSPQPSNWSERQTKKVYAIPGLQTALDLGNARILNIVVMGALSALLNTDPTLWERVIENRVPQKLLALNLEAFRKGRMLIENKIGKWTS